MMLNTKFTYIFVLYIAISHTYGVGQRGTLCDVGQWYANLTQHIDDQEVELNGRQSSSLRKIRHLIEDYKNERVVKPCSLLTTYGSVILEDNDEEVIDFNELDITTQQIATNNAGVDDELDEERHHPNSHPDIDEEDNNDHLVDSPQSDKNKSEEENPDLSHSEAQNQDKEVADNNELDVDPTDLSSSDYDDVDDNNDDDGDNDGDAQHNDDQDVNTNTPLDSVVPFESNIQDLKVKNKDIDSETPHNNVSHLDDKSDPLTHRNNLFFCYPWTYHTCYYWDFLFSKIENIAKEQKEAEKLILLEGKEDLQKVEKADMSKTSRVDQGRIEEATLKYVQNKEVIHEAEKEKQDDNMDITNDVVNSICNVNTNINEDISRKKESTDNKSNVFSGQIVDGTTENRKIDVTENLYKNPNNDEMITLKSDKVIMSEISSMMKQQELQQTKKIDQLELEMVKLENKVLTHSLDKNDDVNNVQHLENHILKLENNLLKLNQSYNKLQRDHNNFKKKQQNTSNIKTCLDIHQPKTDQNTQLITQQKSQIWELTQVIANQTLNLQQIQRKSSFLEEQNEYLFKMVMDQSALITNMLAQIQELNENSVKTKLETKELKLLFDHALTMHDKRESDHNMYPYSRSNGKGEVNKESTNNLQGSAVTPSEPKSNNEHTQRVNVSEGRKGGETEINGTLPDGILSDKKGNVESGGVKEDSSSSEMHTVGVRWTSPSLKKSDSGHSHDEEENKSDIGHFHEEQEEKDTGKEKDNFSDDKRSPKENESPVEVEVHPLRNKNENQKQAKDKIQKAKTEEGHQKHKTQKRVSKQPSVHTLLYSPLHKDKPCDCYDLYTLEKTGSGVNKILVSGLDRSLNIYCNIDESDGWTVLLRREHGNEDFYRDYEAYKEGFGSPRSDHYLGNEVIHYLTNQKHYNLKVELTDWDGNTKHAIYDEFWLDDESDHFRLHVRGYSGTAGDGLAKHNGMRFSTFDVDNDLLKTELGGSCAKRFKGAGWYFKCYQSNLMGIYYEGGKIPDKKYDGITWKPWTGANYSMKSVTMSIRPKRAE